MPYKHDGSPAWGRHYGQNFGGGSTVTRVVFTATDLAWVIPPGVTTIDMLIVGGGGSGIRLWDTSLGIILLPCCGGGGGGIVVVNGVNVVGQGPLRIIVGPGGDGAFPTGAGFGENGGESRVENSVGVVFPGCAAAGGGLGLATNGSGRGGTYDTFVPDFIPPLVGDGTGGDGGIGDPGLGFGSSTGGGGGGAGANGSPGGGSGGNGGNGATPAASSFGAWGVDIGEGGVFGGGGPGGNGDNNASGARGSGGGAANTGGAGGPALGIDEAGDGFSGCVVFMYQA